MFIFERTKIEYDAKMQINAKVINIFDELNLRVILHVLFLGENNIMVSSEKKVLEFIYGSFFNNLVTFLDYFFY